MPRILCNLPLECFEDRASFSDIEIVTYGPRQRMLVDGVHYPFDVEFDPSTGSWDELERALPAGFRPDFVLLWWPDQEPVPAGLQHCPVPVVGMFSDYNLSLPGLAGLWPFFDLVLCDRAGVDLFRRLSYADVQWFCQYTFKRPFHRLWPDVGARDLDVAFAGNLNPQVQRERAPWLERVRDLDRRGVRVEVRGGVHGEAYGRLLNRARIGWNRSIRGEMNLRAFEVPACGALLLMERDNLEVRDFLVPDEECVLYGNDDFESVVFALLADEPRRARIAAAGHARIQQYAMGRRLAALCELVGQRRPDRPSCSDGEAELARAIAMLGTWAAGPATTAACVRSCQLLPDDPRALNALAVATLRWRGNDGVATAVQLLQRACAASASFVPAAVNLAEILRPAPGRPHAPALRDELCKRIGAGGFADLCGPTLPLGYSGRAIERSLALQHAVRTGDVTALGDELLH
jgi:hypothetical protein